MYIFFNIMILLCFLFFIFFLFKRKYIIKKINNMDYCQKICLLNRIVQNFGFCYLPEKDIMTSSIDAWQKKLGYCTFYDKTAYKFNMVFDCEPIYFDYDNSTWRIELWKGQYGINIGSEIGIYKANRILLPNEYDTEKFFAVPEYEMPFMCACLNYQGSPVFCLEHRHWWLTGFSMGKYCEPENLTMCASITFPCDEMLNCFVYSLQNLGYTDCEICVYNLTVTLVFSHPHSYQPRLAHRFRARFSQWQNRIFCRLFIAVTKPFSCTSDRLLYLYYYLPHCFRHTLKIKNSSKRKKF